MNEKTIVLTRYKGSILCAFMDEKRPLEFRLFNEGDDSVGSIYVCMIKDIIKSIGASFVTYGDNKTGFLKSTAYKRGSLVPLQLKKKGDEDKAPQFTDELSLTGMYTILRNSDKNFAISQKITGDNRKEIKETYESFFGDPEYGITLRTNSLLASKGEVLKEADSLAGIMDDILNAADKRTCGTVLYKGDTEWEKHCIKADAASLEHIITDDIDIYDKVKNGIVGKFCTINSLVKIELYEDKMLPLKKLYSIESGLEEAVKEKVWLKSGGFLYIEQTKALASIDVNTGKNISKTDKETTFFETNMEATEEIARQIRLRNLCGIILIDYINMTQERHLNQVTGHLKKLICQDPVKTKVHDVTELGLVELTRQKELEPLKDQLERAGENYEVTNG